MTHPPIPRAGWHAPVNVTRLTRSLARWFVAALALSASLCAVAQDQGDWIIRARVLHLKSANVDGTGFGLSINDKTFPELDITRFFTPNLAAELILALPQKHTIHSDVVGDRIGTFKHLPPTLTLQYHHTGLVGFRPYIGLGVNFTRLFDVQFDSNVSALNLNVKRSSAGLAAQIGTDVPLGSGWLLNLDVKKVQIRTTVGSAGQSVGDFKVNPTLVSIGVGRRF
jgi:outer membrane protein